MKRKLVTAWMIFIWIIIAPVIAFTSYSNCWYYALMQKIKYGGNMVPISSKRWSGHHWIWIDEDMQPWEYTLTKMPKFTPWYKLIVYKGVVRKFRTL